MTNEQKIAFERFRKLAGRYRVLADIEGWPVIPGKYGAIEWYCDGVNCHSCPLPGKFTLAVDTDRRLMRSKILAVTGVRVHQRGDDELRAVFEPEALPAVARAIRARVRRSADAAKHLVEHAYRATPALVSSARGG